MTGIEQEMQGDNVFGARYSIFNWVGVKLYIIVLFFTCSKQLRVTDPGERRERFQQVICEPFQVCWRGFFWPIGVT